MPEPVSPMMSDGAFDVMLDELFKKIEKYTQLRKRIYDLKLAGAFSAEKYAIEESMAATMKKEIVEWSKRASVAAVDNAAKTGVLRKFAERCAKIGFSVFMHGMTIAEAAEAGVLARIFLGGIRLFGRALILVGGAVLDILLNPSEISGVEQTVVDTFDIEIDGHWYRFTWYSVGYSDELSRSLVQRIDEIPAPPKP